MKKKKDQLPLVMDFVLFEPGQVIGTTIRRRIYNDKKHGPYINVAGFKLTVDKAAFRPITLNVPNLEQETKKLNARLDKIARKYGETPPKHKPYKKYR